VFCYHDTSFLFVLVCITAWIYYNVMSLSSTKQGETHQAH